MDSRSLLIVSSGLDGETLCRSPFDLDPETFLLTRLESLRWLGFSRFSTVVLHEPPPGLLHKLTLGLRDDPESEALWGLLHDTRGPRVLVLVPAPVRPLQAWVDLGLEPVLPRELAALAGPTVGPGSVAAANLPRSALTADDIRELHRQGARQLPAGRPLTDWAREVAAALGLTETQATETWLLWPLRATGRKDLQALSGKLFESAQALPSLAFVLAPPMIPVFHDLFPALKGRVVSSNVHWASHGAFTGETSVPMLVDQGVRGAIFDDSAPYNASSHLQELLNRAQAGGLIIFPRVPLERLAGCDIMAPHSGKSSPARMVIPLGRLGDPSSGAWLVDDRQLGEAIRGKGRL